MFEYVVSRLKAETRAFIEEHIEEARQYIQSDTYNRADDDITPHIFEEIGEALFLAVYSYPEEPEPEPPPPLVLEPGEQAFYCRKCEAPRAFTSNVVFVDDETGETRREYDPLHPQCTVCGAIRVGVKVSRT